LAYFDEDGLGTVSETCVSNALSEGMTAADLLWELDGYPEFEFESVKKSKDTKEEVR